ncbi:hypothetical protein ACM66B_007091 [Microbotryomycetes sp. NB124-2]
MAADDSLIDPTLESFDIPVSAQASTNTSNTAPPPTGSTTAAAVGQVQPAPFAVAPSAAAKAAQQQQFQHQSTTTTNGQSSLEDDLNWAMLDGGPATAEGGAAHHLDDLPVDGVPAAPDQSQEQQQQPSAHQQQQQSAPAQPFDQLTSAAASMSENVDDIPVGATSGQQDTQPAATATSTKPRVPPKRATKRKRQQDQDTSDDDYPEEADWSAAVGPTEVSETGRPVRHASARWTAEEDEQLIEYVKKDPPLSWTEIGEKLGKRGQVAGQRWYNVLSVREENQDVKRVEPNGRVPKGMIIKEDGSEDEDYEFEQPEEEPLPVDPNAPPKVKRNLRRWKGEDDEKLKELVEKYADNLDESWEKIAQEIGHDRTWKACRGRYDKTIKPPTEEEEQVLDELLDDEDNILVEDQLGEEDDDYKGGDDAEADVEYDVKKRPAPSRARDRTTDRAKGHFTPAGQSPMFLANEELVENPPIPFTPQSVIRGRRTLKPDELLNKIAKPGKQKKIHTCPAQHCNAAFKRSEHLKRHYKSVHMGSKPFPCQEEGCSKAFSRKDNLQQHMAMVHSKKAIKLDHPENGVTHRYEDMTPAENSTKRRAPSARKSAASAAASEAGSVEVGSPMVSVSGDHLNPDLMDEDSAVHAAVAASTSANTGLDTSAAATGGATGSTNFFETVEGLSYDPALGALSAEDALANATGVNADDGTGVASTSQTLKQRAVGGKRRRLNRDVTGSSINNNNNNNDIDVQGEALAASGDIQVDVMPSEALGDGVYTNSV